MAIKNFVWTGYVDRPKLVTVAWNFLFHPINMGGLGLKNLKLFNFSLIAKFVWRLLTVDSLVFNFPRA